MKEELEINIDTEEDNVDVELEESGIVSSMWKKVKELLEDINNIKNKNTQQDTDIQSNADDIEALKQENIEKDTEIAKLQEKNKDLRRQLPKRRSKWRIY